MATMKLTLLGIENYISNFDKSVFDKLILPPGFNKADIENHILMRAGEMEVLYPDPDFLSEAIGLWGKKWYRTFKRWAEALSIEYKPLENYDRYEDWTDNDTNKGESKSKTSGSDSTTSNNDVSAYDSNSLEPSSRTINNGSNVQDTGVNSEDTRNSIHSGHLHGNIGVTTSQQMLTDELKVSKWNLADNIADCFITEFCIMTY